jgi:hypothetical protein
MNTSIRIIDAGAFAVDASAPDIFTQINILTYDIPESTFFLTVYCDPTMTQGIFAYPPDAPNVVPVGLYIPPGQAVQLGPFRKEDCPEFGGFESGSFFVSILPVWSERR